jgi:magnesium-transporting ATPase (P-type)
MTSDLRRYASQTAVRLLAGAVFILFVVGLGLVWWIYGFGAALMGLLCLLGALVPIGLILFFLFGLDILVKRLNKE